MTKYTWEYGQDIRPGDYLLTYADDLFGPVSEIIQHQDGVLEFTCGEESMVAHKNEIIRVSNGL